ncbi:RNA polymerase sigma factor SigI [Paenibacillus sp. GCM10023252]|uniref:RNA polymerase sigma factor SigI n=1 Tax=Paenibacillus sp. GCM10023252 TaxID=3252649 RepID=UPI00360EA81D
MMFKRFLRKSASVRPEENKREHTPEEIVLRIREGDELVREEFIADYKPYILKVTSRFCKRYIEAGRDDEFSIALSAFNEAINGFSAGAGRSFLGFAETVIRRRLIDYIRKEQRHQSRVPYSSYEMEDEDGQLYNPLDTKLAIQQYEISQEADSRRMEISEYSKELSRYDISFQELPTLSPKHADSRKLVFSISETLARDSVLYEGFLRTGKLPVNELTLKCGVSRKTVERNRKYIISLLLIMSGSYPYLRSYLHGYVKPQQQDLATQEVRA